ncbi:MAG: aminotransferase class III-fold pyridoxal phosphate-dependent enzyme [bacterium]|nr:aminotransferase class III-fold pyridoxal phosphate-dependent enzyme [bacterium]
MRVVVVGMGSIGRRHLGNLRRLSDATEILAVDPDPQARAWADAHGAVAVFESLEDALLQRADAAVLCTPTGLHLEGLSRCVADRVPVYVEKPIAARVQPALLHVLREADASCCTIVVGANLRYMPGAAELTGLLREKRLGRLVGIHAHAGAYLPEWRPNRELRDYRQSYSANPNEGGAMLDFVHEFDLMRWWGGEVQTVSALIRHASDLQIEAEDVADVLLKFASGATGTLHVDYLERVPRRFIQLLFTEGRAIWDVIAQKVEVVDAAGEVTTPVDLPDYDIDHCYQDALGDFLRAIGDLGQARCVQTGWDGAAALALVDAARASAETSRWVEVRQPSSHQDRGSAGNAGAPEAAAAVSRTGGTSLACSQTWLERARRVIPSATQTLSKGPAQFVQGVAPVYLQRGQGCRVWDVDGRDYLDWAMALGPMILGYGDPDVDAAVTRQLGDGPTFSLMHPLEVEVAELLTEVIPSAEMVRFLKTGSGANSAAVRIARAYTGREVIATCGYHGWHDWSAGTLPMKRGVPEGVRRDVIEFAYNDIELLERCFAERPGEIAAVVMEPMCLEWPRDDFLHRVRDLAHARGALFVLDEVITGFRWAMGGAQAYFDVTPDLSVFGKALANGLPLAAVVGRREVMSVLEDGAFVSVTHGGETYSLAAAQATIRKLRTARVIDALWERGRRLREMLGELLLRHEVLQWYRLDGPDCRFAVTPCGAESAGAAEARSILQQELLRRGILFGGAHVLCAAHNQSALEETRVAYEDALPVVARALRSGRVEDYLEGPVLRPVFEPRRVEVS